MRETGDLIPDMTRFGAFPFEICETISGVYNISGSGGPINAVPPQTAGGLRTFSGITGPGTFYPMSGSLDQILRMFWAVKSWSMTMTSTIGTVTTAVPLCPTNPGITEVVSYSIGPAPLKHLALLDLYNHTGGGTGYTLKQDSGITSTIGGNICVPSDPIQKWTDLMCRKNYFHWSPPQEVINIFADPRSTLTQQTGALKSPYVSIQSVNYTSNLDSFGCLFGGNNVFSYFSLAIMNPDFLVQSGVVKTGERFLEELNPDKGQYKNSLGNDWESGHALTDKWGQITGYGRVYKPSGYIPNVFHKNYIDPDQTGKLEDGERYIPEFNPSNHNSYFPLIHFFAKFRNSNAGLRDITLPADTVITTRAPFGNARSLGNLTIYDVITNDSATGTAGNQNARVVASIPLYGGSAAQWFNVNVTLAPEAFWINNSGLNSGILI